MASAITCDLCQSEPAEMMQSNLGNGETISVGAACMVTFFAGALASMVGQLDGSGRTANELSLVMITDAIGLLPASELSAQPPPSNADLEYQAAKALINDPSLYEEGNTDYGVEEALELAQQLVAEYEAAQREGQAR